MLKTCLSAATQPGLSLGFHRLSPKKYLFAAKRRRYDGVLLQ